MQKSNNKKLPLHHQAIYMVLCQHFLSPPDLFQPVALPSAGTLPFMQSMLCSLDQHGKNASYSEMPQFPNASYVVVKLLLTLFSEVLHLYTIYCVVFIIS